MSTAKSVAIFSLLCVCWSIRLDDFSEVLENDQVLDDDEVLQDEVVASKEHSQPLSQEVLGPVGNRNDLDEVSRVSLASDRQTIGGTFTLTRRFSKLEVTSQPQTHTVATADKPYVVVYVFAGRKDRMHILMNYMDKMLEAQQVHEVHVWEHVRHPETNPEDYKWVYSLDNQENGKVKARARPNSTNWWLPVYQYYSSTGEFKPLARGVSPNYTTLVKADDDIVYIDTTKFPEFISYVVKHPELFIVHANVVNNGVAAYYQAKRVKGLADEIPETKEYPKEGAYGSYWGSGKAAKRMHQMFLEHRHEFSWEDKKHDNCVKFQAPTISSQGRFSVNFFGFERSKMDKMVELIATNGNDDEHAITTQATKAGLVECFFTKFSVVHLAFGRQREATSMLPAYESLWNEMSRV